jgi:hypothetical protein
MKTKPITLVKAAKKQGNGNTEAAARLLPSSRLAASGADEAARGRDGDSRRGGGASGWSCFLRGTGTGSADAGACVAAQGGSHGAPHGVGQGTTFEKGASRQVLFHCRCGGLPR